MITSGYYIRQDFEKWEEEFTELRYTQYCTAEMALEALQEKLQRFQPLCFKIRDAWKDSKGEQTKMDKMIKVIREDIPKLEGKAKMEMTSLLSSFVVLNSYVFLLS